MLWLVWRKWYTSSHLIFPISKTLSCTFHYNIDTHSNYNMWEVWIPSAEKKSWGFDSLKNLCIYSDVREITPNGQYKRIKLKDGFNEISKSLKLLL